MTFLLPKCIKLSFFSRKHEKILCVTSIIPSYNIPPFISIIIDINGGMLYEGIMLCFRMTLLVNIRV